MSTDQVVTPARQWCAETRRILKLGTLPSDSGSSASAGAEDVLAIWREAKEAADAQLNQFASALRQTGDDYLLKVAEGGVHQFVEGPSRLFVTLQASLFDFTRARGDARSEASAKILVAVKNYRTFVTQSEFIKICDRNRVCGPLTIGKTLDDGLSQLERALARSLD